MRTTKKPKTIRIFDERAVQLVYERAIREHRSFAGAATVSILELLSGNHKRRPTFPDSVVTKDTSGGAGLSMGKDVGNG